MCAGMARADRTLVEDLFADGHIQVGCRNGVLRGAEMCSDVARA